MGITISYRGSQPDEARRRAATEFAQEFARDMEWGVASLSLSRPRAYLGHRTLECPKIVGLNLLPHFACEPVPLVFLESSGLLLDSYVQDAGDNDLRLDTEPIVKTHFSGAAVHEEVCDFLAQLKRRFVPDLEVDDESGFFEGRDHQALEVAFEAAWKAIAKQVLETQAEGAEEFEVGGFLFRPAGEKPAGEFDRVGPENQKLLLDVEKWLTLRYGGFGFTLDGSLASVSDLDLLMSDADDEHWADRLDDPEVEVFTQAAGAYFGRTLVAHFGGGWELDEEEGLLLANVGGIGLRINPFEIAAVRLVGGPCHAFSHHLAVYGDFIRHLVVS